MTKKANKTVEIKEVVKNVVTYTDPDTNEVKEFAIPEGIIDANIEKDPIQVIYENNFYLRIDDFRTAWWYAINQQRLHLYLYSSCDFYGVGYIGDKEVDYDDDDNCIDADVNYVYNRLAYEFKQYGCVYVSIFYDSQHIKQDNEEYIIRLLENDEKVVKANQFIYSTKYEPGKQMFYYTDNNTCLHSGTVDKVTIVKRAGYNTSITYTMASGTNVEERNMATKEMALDWVNAK